MDQYVNQKDDMHVDANGDLLRQTVRPFKLGLAHIQNKLHLRLNTRWCRIYTLGSSEVPARGRWTTLSRMPCTCTCLSLWYYSLDATSYVLRRCKY